MIGNAKIWQNIFCNFTLICDGKISVQVNSNLSSYVVIETLMRQNDYDNDFVLPQNEVI